MPNAPFIPVIGSGFDADAAQQQFFVNRNAATDEANLGRANAANAQYNNWLANVAQMNRADSMRQDEMAQQDMRFGLAQKAQDRREEQARKQFEEGLAWSKESQKESEQAQKDRFEKQLELTKAEEDKQKTILRNFGRNYVDTLKSTAVEYQDAAEKYNTAMQNVMTYGQQQVKEIGNNLIKYDPKTQQIILINNRTMPPPDVWAKVQDANERISQRTADYAGLKVAYDNIAQHWKTVQAPAMNNGFTIKGEGKDVYLYHPGLGSEGETFGQTLDKAKKEAADQTWKEGFTPTSGGEWWKPAMTGGTGTTGTGKPAAAAAAPAPFVPDARAANNMAVDTGKLAGLDAGMGPASPLPVLMRTARAVGSIPLPSVGPTASAAARAILLGPVGELAARYLPASRTARPSPSVTFPPSAQPAPAPSAGSPTGPVDVSAERVKAMRALANGKDYDAVAALYKQRTGLDLY